MKSMQVLVLEKQIEEGRREALERQDVQLDENKWNQLQMGSICPFIIEWKTKTINADQNMEPKIISHLHNISFTNLHYLSLTENNITSIESLSQLKVPNLQILFINHNRINSLKGLRKAYWPKFVKCSFHSNAINEIGWLGEGSWKLLQQLNIDYVTGLQCNNIRTVLKLESPELSYLVAYNSVRIQEQKTIEVLQRKYNDIWFFHT